MPLKILLFVMIGNHYLKDTNTYVIIGKRCLKNNNLHATKIINIYYIYNE